jgi:NADPH-dependent dioxygenase
MTHNQNDVLVAGAGPVGMLSALVLAKAGLHVDLIDKASETAAHSHACILHPRTLAILAETGLADEVLGMGRRIDRVAFYDGQRRCAELSFSELPGEFPFVVVLPQNELEDLLERRLAHHLGTGVHWLHRLADVRYQGDRIAATVDKLCETSKGYPIATWQHAVQKTIQIDAGFLVGADGRDSHVRQLMNIEEDVIGASDWFAVFEFESDAKFANEIRIVLSNESANLFCPLPGKRGRWTFQIAPEKVSDDAHLKDRLHARVIDPEGDEEGLRQMHRLIGQRAPWFDAHAVELDWFTVIDFQRRLAKQYGLRRCWLAGDAAHSTSPLGMQSMNVGLSEAVDLARAITTVLRQETSSELLVKYDADSRNEWRQLLGIQEAVATTDSAIPWTRQRSTRIASCVPASGDDLGRLLRQIGLAFQPIARAGRVPQFAALDI